MSNRFVLLSVIPLFALLLITGVGLFDSSSSISAFAQKYGDDDNSKETESQMEKMSVGDIDVTMSPPIEGSESALVTIIEFGEFQCPKCDQWFQNEKPTIKQDYIDTGKANLYFVDFTFLGDDSMTAANASYCAEEQGKYWEYHSHLYNNQGEINGGWASSTNLKMFASDVGLDVVAFDECLDSGKYDDRVAYNTSVGASHGVEGTPAFFIVDNSDGTVERIDGPQPSDVFAGVIDRMLERSVTSVSAATTEEEMEETMSDVEEETTEIISDVTEQSEEMMSEAGDEVAELSSDVTEQTEEIVSDVEDQVEEIVSDTNDMTSDAEEEITELSSDVTEQTEEIVSEAENQIEETVEDIETVVDERPEVNVDVGDNNNTGGGGCLIATAAYGTELAPQVQFLREIRDNTVMSTASGAAFMSGFNTLYYSFSPTIADMERDNPLFQDAVRVFITPMISTLSIMTLAEDGSEAEVLGLGISVIALNLGMYITAPAAVGFAAYRYVKSRRT